MRKNLEDIFEQLNYHPLTNPHVQWFDLEEIRELVVDIVKERVLEKTTEVFNDFDHEAYDVFDDYKAYDVAEDLTDRILVELATL